MYDSVMTVYRLYYHENKTYIYMGIMSIDTASKSLMVL